MAGEFDVFSSSWAHGMFKQKYAFDAFEDWKGLSRRVPNAVCKGLIPQALIDEISEVICERKFIPAGRYLYAAGREYHQVNNCFLFRAKDTREGWGELTCDATVSLMTGGGIGSSYSNVRPWASPVKRTGGFATGPISLASIINENGRYVMQGGQRRSAIWGGLAWWHPDLLPHGRGKNDAGHPGWLYVKDWSPALRAAKKADPHFPLPMELTNISTIYDTLFFDLMDNDDPEAKAERPAPWGGTIHLSRKLAETIWMANCLQSFKTAEPGFSINFGKDEEDLRNACTEVTSADDGDKCNLGTVWLQRHATKADFARTCRLATIFLMCGGLYSHTPNAKIQLVGTQNNRIGLGLGGFHEWLMSRGYDYEVGPELHEWLAIYRDVSDEVAVEYAHVLGVNIPKGKRAIAPNGTIGVIAESTTSIEPLFCKGYKRSYVGPNQRIHFQYVVDGAVKRLMAQGIPVDRIKDAYDLGFEQRIAFQANVQDYVDMSISSTCNMPPWGSKDNNDGTLEKNAGTLLKYAKRLRGFTCYPDGCRDGQPLVRVDDLSFALRQEGKVFEERVHACSADGAVCGS